MQEKEPDALQLTLGGSVRPVQNLPIALLRHTNIIDPSSAEVRLPDPLLQQLAQLLVAVLQGQSLHLVPAPPTVHGSHHAYSAHTS